MKKAKKAATKKTVTAPKKKATSKKDLSLIARTARAAVQRNKQKGDDALALIGRKVEQIAEAFYDIALALQILQRKEIYSALGASSFAELVESRTSLSRSTAFELVRIPEHLSREMAVKLGSERARSVIQLVDATTADDQAETLARTDASIEGKPLSQHTARSIEEAARDARVRGTKKRPSRPGEDEARAAAARIEAKLEKASKKELTIVPTRRADGWWVRLELPAELLDRVTITPRR
ncbi:hypothetical protein [Sandaracinus amylolyticus]|uniref:hypothetical protein n=1 Tax=Sandaracinus amylolyticus TaxID=927083 RepID=UPI001F212FC3|nr:hypothetical protein [Sandaracinus amylolyticus]UJR85651.1 Hypothetical protein I5071_77310 [Sandaracinus amylolyticus]